MIFKVIYGSCELKAYEVTARVEAINGLKSVGYIESKQMLPSKLKRSCTGTKIAFKCKRGKLE